MTYNNLEMYDTRAGKSSDITIMGNGEGTVVSAVGKIDGIIINKNGQKVGIVY